MEAPSDFLSSLKELANLTKKLVNEFGVKEEDYIRAGLSKKVFQSILDANLRQPLDQITFGNLMRTFELKSPGFRKSSIGTSLQKSWNLTQKTYAKNGGSRQQQERVFDSGGISPKNHFQVKSAAWILAVLLKKIMSIGLIQRAKFQRDTRLRKDLLDDVLAMKVKDFSGNISISLLINYMKAFLSESEETLFQQALENKEVLLSLEQLEIICYPIREQEKEERIKKAAKRLKGEDVSQVEETDQNRLRNIFSCVDSPGKLLEELMLFRGWTEKMLAVESGCSLYFLRGLLAGKFLLGRKQANELAEALELRGHLAYLFITAVTAANRSSLNKSSFSTSKDSFPVERWKIFLEKNCSWIKDNKKYFLLIFSSLGKIKEGDSLAKGRYCQEQRPDFFLPTVLIPQSVTNLFPNSFDSKSAFGCLLRKRRLARNFSQKELAQKVGCSNGVISNAEQGKSIPLEDFVRKIAKMLHFRGEDKSKFFRLAGLS